jgi:hypothetical protein
LRNRLRCRVHLYTVYYTSYSCKHRLLHLPLYIFALKAESSRAARLVTEFSLGTKNRPRDAERHKARLGESYSR